MDTTMKKSKQTELQGDDEEYPLMAEFGRCGRTSDWTFPLGPASINRLVGDKRLVIEAEDLGDIVEIGVLSHKSPLGVVHLVVEVGDSDLHSPIILVIDLHMPMHSYRAHMLSALQQWCIIFPWSVNPRRFQPLRVTRPDKGEEDRGGNNLGRAASVARARTHESEVGGELDGRRSTIVGVFLQQCGTFPLNLEQSPCSVACAPTIDHITSFLAHDHPSVHPGLIMALYI
nr:Os03g0416250 [Ipomoea batatas]